MLQAEDSIKLSNFVPIIKTESEQENGKYELSKCEDCKER